MSFDRLSMIERRSAHRARAGPGPASGRAASRGPRRQLIWRRLPSRSNWFEEPEPSLAEDPPPARLATATHSRPELPDSAPARESSFAAAPRDFPCRRSSRNHRRCYHRTISEILEPHYGIFACCDCAGTAARSPARTGHAAVRTHRIAHRNASRPPRARSAAFRPPPHRKNPSAHRASSPRARRAAQGRCRRPSARQGRKKNSRRQPPANSQAKTSSTITSKIRSSSWSAPASS